MWRQSIATGSQVSSSTAHEVPDNTVAGEGSMSDASILLHAAIAIVQVAYRRAAIALQAGDDLYRPRVVPSSLVGGQSK